MEKKKKKEISAIQATGIFQLPPHRRQHSITARSRKIQVQPIHKSPTTHTPSIKSAIAMVSRPVQLLAVGDLSGHLKGKEGISV